MKKESRKKLSEVFDVIGELCAFLAIAVLAFICVNGVFEFITDPDTLHILQICKLYSGLALIIITGFEATVKRSLLVRIVFYVLVAIVIVFQFFPGAWDAIVGVIK
jgi:hypothetical protein